MLFDSYTHPFFEGNTTMSSASFYDWEKSLQSNPAPQLSIPSPSKKQEKVKKKPQGTIDFFIAQDTPETPKAVDLDELNDIGDLIFRQIVKRWKMKNLE